MMKSNKGFSLVEVLIVAAIISLLASIAIPNIIRARIESNEAAAQATLKTISTALENYYTTNNQYPASTAVLTSSVPPYLNENFFGSTYNGFNFSAPTLTIATYEILAEPSSSAMGTRSFTISTGGVLNVN
ncbi:MAG: prepilin-type N-terminal cleavage/methylation domain-containing protein [Candidatus Omnitrophica bacterium]|nr:prepilin-type N-terminal cleavage/methylation domain-containing protein [Candidatus Omnitrophota bacterium]